MYICVFIFLPYSKKSECPWQAGAIAIFLAWINFIWFLKRIPAIGIYMIMVKKIFVTFLKVRILLKGPLRVTHACQKKQQIKSFKYKII